MFLSTRRYNRFFVYTYIHVHSRIYSLRSIVFCVCVCVRVPSWKKVDSVERPLVLFLQYSCSLCVCVCVCVTHSLAICIYVISCFVEINVDLIVVISFFRLLLFSRVDTIDRLKLTFVVYCFFLK